ncbi:unnamed protein product [Symbiodinium sp. CCMP2592]|nr:unnamed protein product [Symbiodinium sp. CCMP2592]
MAENEGIKEWVEGFDETGKPLERITKSDHLQDLQRKMKKEEVDLNKLLQKEELEMLELQNKLKDCNDEFTEERQQYDELRQQQRVTLDTDQKIRIQSVTRETIDRFLRRRPKNEDEQMMVDVHFLTGTETTGFNLHINGEGAGSRDAKFLVHLNEKVESLGKQAAKYWGLDPDKVFFLDGDGRIVLDNMDLVDIILPPVPPSQSASASFKNSASSSSVAVVDDASPGKEGEAPRERDFWMVKGRNYCLTLVRASTVLSKEDLNRPKGEKWEDFTFNERQLEKELENARKKRGGDDSEAAKVNMDVIPSLNDLMQQGQEKKRKKRADARFRLLEFSVFLLCQLVFLLSMIQPGIMNPSLLMASNNVERIFSNFTESDNSSAFVPTSPTFYDIVTAQQYWQWLTGPVQRTLLDGTSLASSMQIDILRTLTTRFVAQASSGTSPLFPTYTFCDGTAASNTSNASNATLPESTGATSTSTQTPSAFTVTATSTSTSTQSSSTFTVSATSTSTQTSSTRIFTVSATVTSTQTSTRTSTAVQNTATTTTTSTSVSIPNPVVVSPADISCIPEQFRSCPNLRAMHILGKGQELGHEVPACSPIYDINVPGAYLASLTHSQVFSFAQGKIGTYFDGERSYLDVTNGTEAFLASLETLTASPSEPFTFQGSAQQLTIVVYGATPNAIFIFHFLVENSLSGGLVPTIHKDVFQLDPEPTENHVYLALVSVLALLLLFMEIRRILHCPASCTFEEDRTKCSVWTLLFLLLPALIFAITCLMVVQDLFTGNLLQAGQTSDEDLYDYLWLRIKMDRSRLAIIVITLFLFNVLMLKYLLLHFPQLLSATQIVSRPQLQARATKARPRMSRRTAPFRPQAVDLESTRAEDGVANSVSTATQSR